MANRMDYTHINKYIVSNHTKMTNKDMAIALGVSRWTVELCKGRLGLTKNVKRVFTAEEDAIITDNPDASLEQLHNMMPDRGKSSIWARKDVLTNRVPIEEPKEKIVLGNDWHKSYVAPEMDEEHLLAIKLQRLLRGTYANRG